MYNEDIYAKAAKSLKLKRASSVSEARKKLGSSDNAKFLIGSCDDRLEIAAVFFSLGSKAVPKEAVKEKKKAATK